MIEPPSPDAVPDPGSPHRRYRRLVDAHFRGHGSLGLERDLRPHLVTCAACREYYDRHLRLSAADPTALPSRERLARGLGLASRPLGGRWLRLTPPAAALALAAVLLVVLGDRSAQMGRRGDALSPGSQLMVYEVARDRPPRQVVAEVNRDSGLAFAYANIGRKPHLSVFAVDERRRVYWYHPAWTTPSENPVGVAIATDDAIHEIAQVIYHRLEGTQVQLFGLFADRPVSVRELEAAVSRAPVGTDGRLQVTLPGAQTTRLDLTVLDKE
jgi:hypothetical protein